MQLYWISYVYIYIYLNHQVVDEDFPRLKVLFLYGDIDLAQYSDKHIL